MGLAKGSDPLWTLWEWSVHKEISPVSFLVTTVRSVRLEHHYTVAVPCFNFDVTGPSTVWKVGTRPLNDLARWYGMPPLAPMLQQHDVPRALPKTTLHSVYHTQHNDDDDFIHCVSQDIIVHFSYLVSDRQSWDTWPAMRLHAKPSITPTTWRMLPGEDWNIALSRPYTTLWALLRIVGLLRRQCHIYVTGLHI